MENRVDVLMDYIEENDIVDEAMTMVYQNDDEFNYQFIDGQLKFENGVVYFIDTAEELQESNMDNVHSFPLGVVEIAPYESDYKKHPNDYEYLLCRHGEDFWLSVIRHSPEEKTPERFIENAYSVVREYLTVADITTIEQLQESIERAKSIHKNNQLKNIKRARRFFLPPRKASKIDSF